MLVGGGFARLSEPVLEVALRWSFDGRCCTEEKVLVDLEEDVERPRVLDQGLGDVL